MVCWKPQLAWIRPPLYQQGLGSHTSTSFVLADSADSELTNSITDRALMFTCRSCARADAADSELTTKPSISSLASRVEWFTVWPSPEVRMKMCTSFIRPFEALAQYWTFRSQCSRLPECKGD
jgi:hypothetical protein